MSTAPIIVLGMHRSGTTLVTQLLEQMGLFVGARLDENHEPYYFIALNDWLLQQCGGFWDRPEPVQDLLGNAIVRQAAATQLRNHMRSLSALVYLGERRYLERPSLESQSMKWGWKDPRNTLTLPVWLDVFPQARVVHVGRHGVDVACSLRARYAKSLHGVEQSCARGPEPAHRSSKAVHWWRKWRAGNLNEQLLGQIHSMGRLVDSLRSASLAGGFSLWEFYMESASRHLVTLQDRALDIRFETLLADPQGELQRLAEFCGLSVDRKQLANLASRLNGSRGYAYKSDPEAVAFAGSVRERLQHFGYDA